LKFEATPIRSVISHQKFESDIYHQTRSLMRYLMTVYWAQYCKSHEIPCLPYFSSINI